MSNNHVSYNVLDYAANISAVVKELNFTIMNIQPAISQFITDEAKTDAKVSTQLNVLKRKQQKAAEKLLEDCRNRLVRKGIEEERIDLFTQPKKLGIARDILDKAEKDLLSELRGHGIFN